MKEEITERALYLLEEMASKLGTTVDRLWEVLVKQCYTESLLAMFWCVIATIVMVFTFNGIRYVYYGNVEDLGERKITIITLSLAAGAIFTCAVIANNYEAAFQIINPEYFAYKEIVKLIGE
jgi:hypothetical protein